MNKSNIQSCLQPNLNPSHVKLDPRNDTESLNSIAITATSASPYCRHCHNCHHCIALSRSRLTQFSQSIHLTSPHCLAPFASPNAITCAALIAMTVTYIYPCTHPVKHAPPTDCQRSCREQRVSARDPKLSSKTSSAGASALVRG